ncbi:glycosyltransferase family 4 protein [Paenibacillus sp. HWE-109]|uniref:glycosyltransferase family 4 protein n=1 Tax=Paenibacillus sp. HWE-109 TaxID=1306526 RepID=UPI001EDDC7CB|nr:glycosyltransferase family 4 protein [Paenibacillus sp. HWE-109]UKS27623.1 glycosyltransferase family 4 protein [Paenibacillus sp. HWE-109]
MSTPQQPKVLLFSHICNPEHITGAEKLLLFMTLELGRHYACTLVVPKEGLLAVEARRHGITTIVQSFPLLYDMYHPTDALPRLHQELLGHGDMAGLLDLLFIHEPDLVITNTCVNLLPAAAARKLGIPVTWIIAETIQSTIFASISAELMDAYADWIIGISETTLQPLHRIRERKKFVIPPSWHTDQYDAREWPVKRQNKRAEIGIYDERPVVGYISSDIYANKGLDHFIQMGINICETNRMAHFMITGKPADAVYMESCIQMILLSGYSSQFSILPFEPNIQSVYPAMDVVVIPSLLNEGFGLTALEGLIFGKAVVAYRSGGLSEILASTGNELFLANKGDVRDLTSKVQYLVSDQIARQQVGKTNSQAIGQVFGIDAYRSKLEHFLARIRPHLQESRAARLSPPQFPNQFLLKGEASHTVFLIEQGHKRPVSTGYDFQFYKLDWNRVGIVSDRQLTSHPTGLSIRAEEPFLKHAPAIYIAKGLGPTVYLMQHGIRYPFSSEAAMHHYGYNLDQVVQLPEKELATYALGHPIVWGSSKASTRRKSKIRVKRSLRKRLKKGTKLRRSGKRFAKGGFKARRRKAASRKMKVTKRGVRARRAKSRRGAKGSARQKVRHKSFAKVGGRK